MALTLWRLAGQPAVATPGSATWPDIPVGSVYDDAVGYVAALRIATGTSSTEFSPLDPLTRAQYLSYLWRYAGSPMGYPPHSFDDVFQSWQVASVEWADALGIQGTSPTMFSPDAVITKAEAAAFIDAFLGFPDPPAFDYYDCTIFGA